MAMTKRFLAFDCGATSGRGVLATFDGAGFELEEVCRFPSEMVHTAGRVCWDVDAMFGHFVDCLPLRSSFHMAFPPYGKCVCTLWHGCYLVHSNGKGRTIIHNQSCPETSSAK